MAVPFVDLSPEYTSCRTVCDENMRSVIASNSFIGGEMVQQFEREMALHQGCREIAACGNGTDALWITLKSLGVGPGDEVVTTPCTAIPTAEAITLSGARVVFADVEKGGFHITAETVEAVCTEKTRAILPVHLYGIPCELDGLVALAKRRNLYLIEDCAQAQGARFRGHRVGTFGDAACYSFFPSKNLGGFGDGGAMSARSPQVIETFRCLSNHGRKSKLEHSCEGVNSRLDALQAAVLRAKLPHLDERNALRREVARWYKEELSSMTEVTLPKVSAEAEPVWHLYPVRVKDRDSLMAHLTRTGIGTGLHYAMALHLQEAYRYLRLAPGSLPHAEEAFRTELSLPMFPAMTREQVYEVTRAIRSFYS